MNPVPSPGQHPDGPCLVHAPSFSHAEEALRQSVQQFRSYFELGLIGSAITSPTKGWLEVNDCLCEMLGYSRAELLEKSWAELTHPDDLAADLANFNRVLAGEFDAYSMNKRFIRKRGDIMDSTISVKCLRRPDGSADYFVALIQDVTERKRAEEQVHRVQEELEWRVRERTMELKKANEALREEIRERKRAEEARQDLLRQLVTAQEEERRRISRELHDEIGQHLSALMLGLKWLQNSTGPETLSQSVQRLQAITEKVGHEVHQMALRLRPTALDDLGLVRTLSDYVEEWSARARVEVDFHCAGLEDRRLAAHIETTLYRVVQEALTNVLKHADARRVSLILERRPDHALAIVEDDGAGFDAESIPNAENRKRLGLLGMKERVALVQGDLCIESSPGQGTTVFVRIPLPAEEGAGT